MRVLIGCEESGVVRRAFRGRGHDAYSCDLLPARDGDRHHFQVDVTDPIMHGEWDLVILHPPCQYIAVSGNRWHAGTKERREAQNWTQQLWTLARGKVKRVALENPVGLRLTNWGMFENDWEQVKPQWVQPWQFGHPTTKKTGLWLHNLPKLEPTDIVRPNENRVWKMPPSATRARDRSTTCLGVADAMAAQWGDL